MLVVLPKLQGPEVMKAKIVLLVIIICQYVPRLLRIIPLYLQITRSAGILTETAWAGAAFNLIIYMLASHVSPLNELLNSVILGLHYIVNSRKDERCYPRALNCSPAIIRQEDESTNIPLLLIFKLVPGPYICSTSPQFKYLLLGML